MKINSIRLKNYRQYKDETIEFSTSDNKNFTIIQGTNGVGKTNILNAITWCLYGKEKHIDQKNKGLPIVNTLTINEMEPGDKCNVVVKIHMIDDENKRIIIGRRINYKKLNNGKLGMTSDNYSNLPDGSIFEMIKQEKNDMVEVKDPEYVLNRLIPESIEEYFFFDGERLNDYFRTTSGAKIREAVFKISQVGLIENAIEHLENKKKDFVRKAGNLSSKAEEIKDELNKSEELLEEYKKRLIVLKREKEGAQKKEDEFSEKLRTSSFPNIRELEQERIIIENELNKIEIEVEELKKNRFDYLIKKAPLIFAYNPIIKTKKLIDSKKEAGDIPPDYKKNFLEKLLKNGKCICGTDISQNNKFRENIEKILYECDDISNISSELTEEYVHLKSITNELKDFRKEQIFYGKKIKGLEGDRKLKNKRLKKISEKIKGFDIEKIKRWENKLKEYRVIRDKITEQIIENKYYKEKEEKELNKLNKLFDEELRKEEKNKKLRKILHFCDNSLDVLRKIKNGIMEDVRKEIEEKTKTQFFDLIWKKDTYKDVKIDENYQISVLNQYGLEGIGTLSAGERQILALSFMAALNSVSGFNVPIIIDTPLGRLSKEPKKNIAINLPNYLKGKQVTLLVTEEEYTQEVRDYLAINVSKEYIINFKDLKNGNESKVVLYDE